MTAISGNAGGGVKIDVTAQDLNKGVQHDRAKEQQVTALAQKRIQAQASSTKDNPTNGEHELLDLVERARRSIDRISYYPSKIEALTVIAVFCASIGRGDKAKSFLSEAEGMLSPITPTDPEFSSTRPKELEYIAKAKAELGEKDQAMAVANKIFSINDRIKLKLYLGYIEEAIVEVEEILDSYRKSMALMDIAKEQASRGEIVVAQKTAALITDSFPTFKSEAMVTIVLQRVKESEDLDQVIAEVMTIPDDTQKNGVLGSIIQVLAKSGKIKEAKQLTEEINDQTEKVASEIAIAEFHVEEKDIKRIEESLSTYGLKDIPIIKFSLLKVQLKRGIESGDIEGAKVLAKGCNQCSAKDEALLAVMQWCIESRNIEAAKAMAEIISSGDADVYRKNVALRLLAGAYASGGNFSAAREAINDISAAEERIKAEFEVYRIREEREKEDKAKILAAE